MKTQIKISGQISGNFTLGRNLHNYTEKKDLPFNNYLLIYSTIKQAKADLKYCFKTLKEENCTELSKDKKRLYYDASKAEIINNN